MAVANVAPALQRRSEPDDVLEVLSWAGEPLATAEVAAVVGLVLDETRERLARVGTLEPSAPTATGRCPATSGGSRPRVN